MTEGQPNSASLTHDASGSSTGMAGLGQRGVEWWADDGGHSIHTPGGYEWWNFESMDAAGNGVVVTLFDGLPFHPYYGVQVARWRRRHARAFTTPPPEVLPSHYPAVYIGIYQGGTRVAQAINVYPPGSFDCRPGLPELRVGPNRLTLRADGSFGLVARAYGYDIHHGTPRARRDLVLSATLNFRPTFRGVQHVRPFRPAGVDGAAHTWVLAAPHGVMTGRVQFISEDDAIGPIDLALNALGYHDHNYGQAELIGAAGDTGPQHDGAGEGGRIKRLAAGHMLGPTYALVWQRTAVGGRTGCRSDAIILFEQDRAPIVIEAPAIVTEQMRTTRWLVKYPGRATLHGSDAKGNSAELIVEHDGLVERSPFHVRLSARATFTIAGRQHYSGVGQTTVLQLQRLGWPLLSDMVLMSLQSIAADDPLWRL
jgi:hypothetical protein